MNKFAPPIYFWYLNTELEFCASVKLNGRELGSVFRSPFRFDLTPALKRGRNRISNE